MSNDRVLYLLGCAAGIVVDLRPAIEQAQVAGWDVCLGLTPTAADWLRKELPELERLTGRPVRHEQRRPGESNPWPAADAVLVAPATFNTINAWALGLTTNWLVGSASEALGRGIPIVVMPCVNSDLGAHPQYGRSLETLRGAGVRILPAHSARNPWPAALAAVERVALR